MTYKILFLLLISTPLWACKTPNNSTIVIGCTEKCGNDYKLRMKFAARAMGYSVKVVDLTEMGELTSALEKVDGVLIPGGADIDPSYYLEKVSPELREYTQNNLHLVNFSAEGKRRDPFEYSFVKKYLEDSAYAKLPLLGICRGMQMMSVAQGIPLYLDIKTELGIKNRKYLFDWVNVQKNTKLDDIYLNDSLRGFKIHHQGLRVSYFNDFASDFPDVRVSAYSHRNQIAEGIEYLSRPAIGVQYHPEKSFTNTSAPIFRWLLKKSCEYKNSKVHE